MPDTPPPLGPGTSDRAAGFLRIFTSSIPIVGAAFTELMMSVIPGVRQQRVEDYCRYLDSKLTIVDELQFRQRLFSEPGIDLFEEGGIQSARALTNERREQIATAVAKGLTGDEAALLDAKRMLVLLRELDDGQVIVLASKLMKNQRDHEFYNRHKSVFDVPPSSLATTQLELDRVTVAAIATTKLRSLGLIRQKFKRPARNQQPNFDPGTGMMTAQGDEITSLGRLLLRTIGLASENEH